MMKVKIETSIEILESFPKQLDRPKSLDQLQDLNFKDFILTVTNENILKKSEALKTH